MNDRNITLTGVSKQYRGEAVLENFSLVIPGGKFFVLLGPSGSGKTTILRLIGGFETPDTGKIFLGDQDITYLPSNQRKINTVFQNYALFPHLTVFDNVAYPLRVRAVDPHSIDERVSDILKTVRLEAHRSKYIEQLSGGQQQRVALARAIINKPDVLLLDEPLAALDLTLRERMLMELVELQDTLKTTFVYVTHDQLEALTVADQMAIMNAEGSLEQIGTPKEIYEFPVSTFIATFVGNTNLLHSDTRTLSIRPEKIKISRKELSDVTTQYRGAVQTIMYHGCSTVYGVRISESPGIINVFTLNGEHFPHEIIDYDDIVYIGWHQNNVVVLER